MKRAAVWRWQRPEPIDRPWFVDVCATEDYRPDQPLAPEDEFGEIPGAEDFPTHAEAMEYALAALGLATPPEHREAP